jgi:hypothetical protein
MCGVSEKTVKELFAELVGEGPSAIKKALAAMPSKCPEELALSITRGFQRRLESVANEKE